MKGELYMTNNVQIRQSLMPCAKGSDAVVRTEYEVLPPGEVIHSDFYFQQLARSQQASRKSRLQLANRTGVIFHYENFTYHIHFLSTRQISMRASNIFVVHFGYCTISDFGLGKTF